MGELCDGLDKLHSVDYPPFLAALFKPAAALLRSVPPQLSDRPEHRLRAKVLEFLNRCPKNDVMAPFAPELFDVCLSVLKVRG